MIYIDPPYNTGKDFIYKDNFTEDKSDYYERSGQSENGIKLTTNLESNGRYHSDWLTMMYPRLFLARNLLNENGVIFVSINDREVANLRLAMDEIFGEENFIGNIVLQTATDNNKTQINTEHEYVISYAKNKGNLPYWSRESEGALLIKDQYVILKNKHKDNFELIQAELRKWIRVNIKKLTKVSHYDNVDNRGVFHDADVANTKFGGYVYDVIHPKTGKPCKVPEKGFRFPKETMDDLIRAGDIIFGNDEATLIKPKKRLENVKDSLRSIIYEDGRASTKAFESLMRRGVFDNPKSHFVLARLIDFCTNSDDIVLDFFAGSGTTAHAVMDLNAEDGGNRKWICVQIPEETVEDSEARKAGYENIAQISRERIRRAGEKIDKGNIGFKALSLSKSNYRQWNVLTDEDDAEKLKAQMKLFLEKPLVDGYDEKSVVYEILLKEGFDLNATVEIQELASLKVWKITDSERKMIITFAEKITKEQVEKLGLGENDIFVCLDSALDDTTKVNIGRNLIVKVI